MSDNPSAFPHPSRNELDFDGKSTFVPEQSGMTLRDWFAGQAMQALLTGNAWNAEILARESFEVADAMLAARKEQP